MSGPVKNAFVWVAGGRNYCNRQRLFEVLNAYQEKHGIRHIITGAQRGADLLAEEWARNNEIPYTGIPAKWSSEGNGAGPKRNAEIAYKYMPDVLIAFPGGPGTVSAINTAKEIGLPVFEIDKQEKQNER